MPSGSLTLTLRPLKLAFLVEPADTSALLSAIETNSLLWGGMYNPIVPFFRRTPKNWDETPMSITKARDVVRGYIDAFDPDYVVLTGRLQHKPLAFGHRSVIHLSEIVDRLEQEGRPQYGISIFEILQHLMETEFKFARHTPWQIRLPVLSKSNRVFLAAVFGQLPLALDSPFRAALSSVPDVNNELCSIGNYWDFLNPGNVLIRRLTAFDIEPSRSRRGARDCMFFMDARNNMDVIDYWNLRALGWSVFPIGKQAAEDAKLRTFVEKTIENNYYPLRFTKNMHNHTTILKSRSCTQAEVEGFASSLCLKPVSEPLNYKLSHQHWMPRIWDEWARDKDGAEPCELRTLEDDTRLAPGESIISAKCIMPKWFTSRMAGGHALCANEIGLRLWGDDKVFAEVIPEGDESVARSAGASGYREWRCGKRGLIFLPTYRGQSLLMDPPVAESVISEWLRARHWKVEISDKGRIGYQLLKRLGGLHGISFLADVGLLDLLGLLAKDCGVSESEFMQRLNQIAQMQKRGQGYAEYIAERLAQLNAAKIGFRLQCPKCQQHSWHSLRETDYDLVCPKCLDQFSFPATSKGVAWRYRALGPFALPQQGYGTYAVLLTLRFFSQLLRGAVSPILSFTAQKDAVDIESDVALFYREDTFGAKDVELVFAECKSKNRFERKDIQRMTAIAEQFPGAILVFATLRNEIDSKEQALLRPLVNKGRRRWKAERPRNPVLILTANELFASFNVRYAWKELGVKYANFVEKRMDIPELVSLADDTQQIYLDMPPWHEWLNRKRRASRQSK